MKIRIYENFIVGILIMCVLISACSSEVVEGTVTKKEYEPSFVMMMPLPMSCGKNICTVMVPIFYPESYEITVSNTAASQTLYINKKEYDLIRVGDPYKCISCITERPYTRKD